MSKAKSGLSRREVRKSLLPYSVHFTRRRDESSDREGDGKPHAKDVNDDADKASS